ncbi:glycosyltransferase [Endozoicomonas sp. ALC020]|uniref:glycosyltransferase n=1 Tax=unclassified Endozoicomonas TaxID=2644528 RepID=UPI003BB115C3
MILVTTGTQFPFDRMVLAVDKWGNINSEVEIFAQIGKGGIKPQHIESTDFLTPVQYSSLLKKTKVIVAHAGMGSILTAYELNIPIIIFPRRFALGEHRNDHQTSTANKFKDVSGIYVATNETEIHNYLDKWNRLKKPEQKNNPEYYKLKNFINSFIEGNEL